MTGEGKALKPLIEECLDEDPTVRPSMVVVCEKIQVRAITKYFVSILRVQIEGESLLIKRYLRK